MDTKKLKVNKKDSRGKKLSKYYVFKSREEKIKFFLIEEYKKGNFYSIPDGIFDMGNPEDIQKLEFLRKKFIFNRDNGQAIPAGLFDLSIEDERKSLIDNLWYKINLGIEVDLSYIPNGLFVDEDTYDKMVEHLIRKQAINNYNKADGVNYDIAYVNETLNPEEEIESYRKEFELKKREIEAIKMKFSSNNDQFELSAEGEASQGEGKKTRLSFRAYTGLLESISKINAASEANGDWRFYDKIFKNKYHRDFKKIEDNERKKDEQEMNKFLRGFYRFKKENVIVNGTEEQERDIEKQKEFVLFILRNLSKTGCLTELIEMENENIKEINSFLPEEQRINEITEFGIFNAIENLDVTNQNDVAKLCVFGRHFINKLAHNYDDLMFEDFLNNSVSQSFYRKNRVLEIRNFTEDIYEAVQDAAKGYPKANEKLEEMMFEIFPTKTKAKKIAENYIGMSKSGRKPESKIKRDIEEAIVRSKKHRESRSYAVVSFRDYRYDCIESLKKLKNDYYGISKSKTGNSRVAPASFEEFFSKILDRTIDKESYRDFEININQEKCNLIDEIESFIQNVELSNTLMNHKEVLRNVVHKMEVQDEIYATKQFFSECLLEIDDKKPGLIRLEHSFDNAGSQNVGGVFDVMLPGFTQMFGGHYLQGEFDFSNYKIENLPPVNPDVGDKFGNGNYNLQSLSVIVPIMKELTDDQVDTFNKLIHTMTVIENGEVVDEERKKELYKYDKLSGLRDESPGFYGTLRVRFALGAGLDVYKNLYGIQQKIELNDVQKKFAEFILSEVDSGKTIDELLTSYGKVKDEIISYVIEKQRQKKFFANPTNEVSNELNKVEKDALVKSEDKKERED